ncbi:hypothetical protein CCHR01_13795 [Colletotrichum chrysophilum]|uniref:Uncharacterized protein n=1 Tax=Colletotrichum chrysophilum TaxID=1836956 RepID=A0AAD9ABF7_9PEZI|nr:hypothetical protein CCHR01_13795 [Colletotrichum chrysophilum]
MVVLAIDAFNGFTSYTSLTSAAIHKVPLAFQVGFLTWLTTRALFGIAAMRPSVVDAIPVTLNVAALAPRLRIGGRRGADWDAEELSITGKLMLSNIV